MELSRRVDHAGTRRSLRDRRTEPGEFAGDKYGMPFILLSHLPGRLIVILRLEKKSNL